MVTLWGKRGLLSRVLCLQLLLNQPSLSLSLVSWDLEKCCAYRIKFPLYLEVFFFVNVSKWAFSILESSTILISLEPSCWLVFHRLFSLFLCYEITGKPDGFCYIIPQDKYLKMNELINFEMVLMRSKIKGPHTLKCLEWMEQLSFKTMFNWNIREIHCLRLCWVTLI